MKKFLLFFAITSFFSCGAAHQKVEYASTLDDVSIEAVHQAANRCDVFSLHLDSEMHKHNIKDLQASPIDATLKEKMCKAQKDLLGLDVREDNEFQKFIERVIAHNKNCIRLSSIAIGLRRFLEEMDKGDKPPIIAETALALAQNSINRIFGTQDSHRHRINVYQKLLGNKAEMTDFCKTTQLEEQSAKKLIEYEEEYSKKEVEKADEAVKLRWTGEHRKKDEEKAVEKK